MREIKFRGKRKDNGEWVYGYYVQSPREHKIVTYWRNEPLEILTAAYCGSKEKHYSQSTYTVIPETVGQFIGLKANGEEVYEGDDVDVSMSFEGGTLPHRGIIVYDETFGAFGTKNEAGITLLHNHCLHTLKIIGNIHEHPKLREQK